MKIINFIKYAYRNIFEYRITENIQKFININKKHWQDFHGDREKGYILVAGMRNSPAYFMVASRVAKSIEEETGYLPIVLLETFNFSSKFWKKIYESYFIKNFIFYKNYYTNIIFLLKSFFLTLDFHLKKKNVEDLLKLNYNGIYIGDLIYDTILRNNFGLYTINKVKLKYFRYIYSAFLAIMIYEKIFNKYDIKYVYSSLAIFTKWGILVRVADKKGATVILANRKLMKNYRDLDICEGEYRPRISDVDALKNSRKVYEDIDNYLNKRFSGNVCEIDAVKSYKGKISYNREMLCGHLKLDKNKPIVFIMPHAFSDGSHHTPIDNLLFRDYYTWLVETIKYVSAIKNTNWLIKPHPMSFKYKEEGEVEKLVKLYGKDNLHIVPENFNTMSIKDIADAVITVQGKSGLEFSCFGIPTIITSKAFYSGFGVAIEPKTVKEYFNLLKNIYAIPKLNNEQIKNAKVLSAIIFMYLRTNDPLLPWKEDPLYCIRKDEEVWKKSYLLMKNYDKSNDEFYQRIKDLLNLNFYRKYLTDEKYK